MAMDTKERILALALERFSQNGYAGTNVRKLTVLLLLAALLCTLAACTARPSDPAGVDPGFLRILWDMLSEALR